MRKKDQILVLRRMEHKDNTYILDTLAASLGRKSFVLKTGRTLPGKRHRSLSVPMQFLEIEWVGRDKWPRIVRMVPVITYKEIFRDFRKNAHGYFILENIRQLVLGNEDGQWYKWAMAQFRLLDEDEFSGDFPLHFLADLLERLGIAPVKTKPGGYFDIMNDTFISSPNSHTWDKEKSALFRKFLLKQPLNNAEQREIIYNLVESFLKRHFPSYHLPASLKFYNLLFDE